MQESFRCRQSRNYETIECLGPYVLNHNPMLFEETHAPLWRVPHTKNNNLEIQVDLQNQTQAELLKGLGVKT